ncbi:TetR family transcriptional regulator [Shumkonia mesophila]|uniref:TetR family transcriptional regulator n=1 Tax=Shumkonia mesophila TaxID=2838854 RepID=UPI0029341E48|nr:TetR family transcriptional regulator [Shumkonia mesophila]
MRRTKAEAEQTREALLRAAIEVFYARGVGNAALDEIARTAGMTRGAVYWHFRDKLEIFSALEKRVGLPNAEFIATMKARLEADLGLDPLAELAATIAEGLRALENDSERRKILTILWLRCEYVNRMLSALTHRRQADAELQNQLLAVIRLGAERGRLAPAWSPERAARALFLLLNGSVEDWLQAPDEVRLVDETMPVVEGFLEAISEPRGADNGSGNGLVHRLAPLG